MTHTQSAYHFFLSRAGYSYNPQTKTRMQGRIDGAKRLAAAEKWAQASGVVYVWMPDEDCSEDDFEFEEDKQHIREHGAVGCILYRPCPDHGTECKHAEVLGSLWGITESLDNRERDAYRRVVEAELASDAMPS